VRERTTFACVDNPFAPDFEVFLIPIVNPDGRGALERSGDYCWRGNGDRVDFARNFDWNFGGEGSSGARSFLPSYHPFLCFFRMKNDILLC